MNNERDLFSQENFAKELSGNILSAFSETPNISLLQNEVNDLLQQNFSWKSINDIVYGNSTRPNIWAVMGICKVLGLDFNDAFKIDAIKSKGSDLLLRDTNYMNHYYGFMYLRNEGFDDLTEIELIIDKKPNACKAMLKYTNNRTGIDYKFYGVPKYNQTKDLIYIMFADKEIVDGTQAGDPSLNYYHFYFEYKKFDGRMHYRKGFSISKSKNQSCPLVMDFCIFDRKIPLEEFKNGLNSLLLFDDGKFVVPKDKADEIIPTDNEEAAQIFTKGKSMSSMKEEDVYVVNEAMIISNLQYMLNTNQHVADELFSLLLKLKACSISPKRIAYNNTQHDFIRRIMDKYPQETFYENAQQ